MIITTIIVTMMIMIMILITMIVKKSPASQASVPRLLYCY